MLDKKVLLQITLILCLVTFVSDVFADQQQQHRHRDKRARHQKLALAKIQRLGGVERDVETHCHQRIDTAQRKPAEDGLQY